MLAVGSKNTDLAGKPTIRLDVPLKTPSEGIVIDFMRMAEEKYGFDTVHPEVKAAALDLVGDDEDNDEMEEEEVDLGAAENGATPGTANSTAKKPKNRGKIEGKYDLNDPFIDDSEMLWEEQAASTKDGFFVYSGALFNKGEAPQIERADGSIKKVNPAAAATGTSTPGTKPKQTRKKKAATGESVDAPPKKKAKKKAEKAEKVEKADKADKEKGDKAEKHEKSEKADKTKAETSSTTTAETA